MAGVVTPELVAAVGKAGGLGILPATGLPPEDLRSQIRKTRSLFDGPFGVNLLLHPDIRRTADVAAIPEGVVAAVQEALNRFRTRLGLAPTLSRPAAPPLLVDAAIEAILEERVPVFSIGLGRPEPPLVSRFHARGAKVIAMAATPADALELAASGVDAIVAQGGEAGGHRSTWVKRESAEQACIGTLALVPQVVRAVEVPVVAAGGIMDGRGLLAALALGASGAFLGTRFIATVESGAPPFYKKTLLDAEGDPTTLTDSFTGLWARVLRNAFTEEYRASKAPVFPAVLQHSASSDVVAASAARGDPQYYPLYAGQGVGLIDAIPSAADVVTTVVREALQVLDSLGRYRPSQRG
jgi:nitronate monooxygenase